MPLQLSDHSILLFFLMLQSVLHQNLTCPSLSYCRILMILDTLKNELKSPFTANLTKSFLLHADKNGKHFCEQNLHNGNENGEHICVENFHGDHLNTHNINKLSCTHQRPQETQHLCLPEICLCSVGPEHQPSKRYTLMHLGVPIRSKSYIFGDNKSVDDSASIPTSTLSKKSTLASFHRVREAIATGYLQFNWKDGKSKPADIISKHWEFASIWPLLKPLLFWKGDTHELTVKTKGEDRISA